MAEESVVVSEEARRRIWVPMDESDLNVIDRHVANLKDDVGVLKFGLQLIHRYGTPFIVDHFGKLGILPERLFGDGKFDDIPNTVGEASAAMADLGVGYFNVHASAGAKAIEAAAKCKGNSKLLVVTVLTSLTAEDLQRMYVDPFVRINRSQSFATPFGLQKYIPEVVLGMAIMAAEYGADGIICSPQELAVLNQDAGLRGMEKYTPGIRPVWAATDDQQRITTPRDAILGGATGIIVGRPLLKPPAQIGSPQDAALAIGLEIDQALAELAAA